MLTATLPFYSNDDSVVSKRIRAADYDKKVLDREDIGGNGEFSCCGLDNVCQLIASFLAKDMVASLLTIDRKKRPSAEQALEHPWFANKKAILLKLYDKMLRKSGWQAPAAPVTTSARPPTAAPTAAVQSRGATTVRHSQNREPLAPATPTPAPRPKETPKTVGMLGQASETDFVAGTPCLPETAKRPREFGSVCVSHYPTL
jgi:serine/threonine protein kinase